MTRALPLLKRYRLLYIEGDLTFQERDEGLRVGTLGSLTYLSITVSLGNGFGTTKPQTVQWRWDTMVKLTRSDVNSSMGAFPASSVGDDFVIRGVHNLDFDMDAHAYRIRGHCVLLDNGRWQILFQEIEDSVRGGKVGEPVVA